MKYSDLSIKDKRDIINRVQAENGLNRQIIEKDWWVTTVLKALFSLPYAEHISFKGGTNFIKCWHLINRMSEDVDIAIDREYLGLGGILSKTQISDKLRRASCSFVREKLQYDVAEQLVKNGIKADKFTVLVNITPITTTDPEIIEVSGRSMNEPVIPVSLRSFMDEVFTQTPFTEPDFEVRAVAPQRTFLEKVFLLHEEFSKPKEHIRTERMSRHLYDIGQMMNFPIAEEALNNKALYISIIEHRKTFIGLKGFDYQTLYPQTLNIILPEVIYDAWKKDYEVMQETMIYGESLPFDKLASKIRALNERIHKLPY